MSINPSPVGKVVFNTNGHDFRIVADEGLFVADVQSLPVLLQRITELRTLTDDSTHVARCATDIFKAIPALNAAVIKHNNKIKASLGGWGHSVALVLDFLMKPLDVFLKIINRGHARLLLQEVDGQAVLNNLLLNAVKSKNTDVVTKLLDASRKHNSDLANAPIGPGGKRALHIAAENGSLELVNILIQRGANLFEKDQQGFTPLHWVIVANGVNNLEKASIFRLLLDSLHHSSSDQAIPVIEELKQFVTNLISENHPLYNSVTDKDALRELLGPTLEKLEGTETILARQSTAAPATFGTQSRHLAGPPPRAAAQATAPGSRVDQLQPPRGTAREQQPGRSATVSPTVPPRPPARGVPNIPDFENEAARKSANIERFKGEMRGAITSGNLYEVNELINKNQNQNFLPEFADFAQEEFIRHPRSDNFKNIRDRLFESARRPIPTTPSVPPW